MATEESMFEDSFGGMQHGPGPEDFANGGAALAAGLVREAQSLAQAAAALRAASAPGPDGAGDVRRLRLALHAAGEAAMRAALALDAAVLLGDRRPAAEMAPRIADAAKRAGLPPATLAPMLRAAALDFRTDDAAARIAASTLAAELCVLLAADTTG
ncbi:MAG TPA: hypothetical protein VGN83_08535 [Falsiroseomonas sp.]|jgi:hypothetical protein|nr:hypothetical protein [Falsiroseomonas sp.]